MFRHRGRILELAIRISGTPLSEVAKKLGVSRNALYSKFNEKFIEDSILLDISKIIDFDLKILIPELEIGLQDIDRLSDTDGKYIVHNKTFSKQLTMYEELLDQYRILLVILLKLSMEPLSGEVRNKIYHFLTKIYKEN